MTQRVRTIIVVDDQPVVRRSMARSLRLAGLEVLEFASAEELLMAPSAWNADCFLFDVHLTGMSGPDLYRTLRSKGVQTPVVFVTADATAIHKDTVMEPGVSTYLLKPFERTVLLLAVDEAMSLDRQAQDRAISNQPSPTEGK
jgi:FixJ family two-component response regulator